MNFKIAALLAALAFQTGVAQAEGNPAGAPATREFEFTYKAWVHDVPKGVQTFDLWVPIAHATDQQEIELILESVPPGAQIATEPKYGNQILYKRFTAPFDDDIGLELRYRVKRHEVVSREAKRMEATSEIPSRQEVEKFLRPNVLVPVDGEVRSLALSLELTGGNPIKTGRKVYDHVLETMTYDKSTPGWGRGDVLWACDSRTGNCSDFHSVFIALNRSQKIPAYFEIGFPLPADKTEGTVSGYHCWAWFEAGDAGWVPVDISEADKNSELSEYYFGALSADRLSFTVGRDLTLVPPQQGPPLNFFVYPYAELDGKPFEGMKKAFSFRDVQGEGN